MKKDDFVELFLKRFSGHPDHYAIWFEPRYEGGDGLYTPSTWEPNWDEEDEDHRERQEIFYNKVQGVVEDIGTSDYGLDAVEAHLTGDHFLGVYPLKPDSTCRFFALDFDKEPEEAWSEAVRQQRIFREEAGIETYIERSRSGNGYHLWGFLEEDIEAGTVRHALAHFIEDADTYDRMFPHQDTVHSTRKYGNLIALPLYGPKAADGKGVFIEVDGTGSPRDVDSQIQFLQNVSLITREQIEELFDSAPEPYDPSRTSIQVKDTPPGELQGSWKLLSPHFGCNWLQWGYEYPREVPEPAWYAMACQFAQLEDGRELFHKLSAQDVERYDPRTTDRKFEHALRQNAPQTCEYIRSQGWGPGCYCDQRFDRVYHPYDLADLPLSVLMEAVDEEQRVEQAHEGMIELVDWLGQVQDNPEKGRGKKYGIGVLDKYTGIRDGNLIVVGARPGLGKTALGVHTAARLSLEDNVPAYLFSHEMQSRELWLRFMCWMTGIDSRKALEGKLTASDWKKIDKAAQEVDDKRVPFFVDDVTIDSNEIVDMVGNLYDKHGKGVIFADYLQLAKRWPNESSRERTERVVSQYRRLAKVVNMPFIALAQLNRGADDATVDSETFDSWLKESGQIEQDAHVIMYILGNKVPGVICDRTIMIHKERAFGGNKRLTVQFNKSTSRFADPGTWNFQSTDRHRRRGGDSPTQTVKGGSGQIPVLNRQDLMKHITGESSEELFGGLGGS